MVAFVDENNDIQELSDQQVQSLLAKAGLLAHKSDETFDSVNRLLEGSAIP